MRIQQPIRLDLGARFWPDPDWAQNLSSGARMLEVSHGRASLKLSLEVGGGTDASDCTQVNKRWLDHYRDHDEPPLDAYVFERNEALSMQRLHTVLICLPMRIWGERRPEIQIVFVGTKGGVDGNWFKSNPNGKA